jgi:hypothetical protein
VQGVVFVLVIIAAVASRPIEARLWRAGRLSDRTTAILLLGRFPVLCLVFGLMTGASLPVLVGITALAMVPSALFYRFTLDLLRDQKRA